MVDDDHGRARVAQCTRRGEAVREAHVEHDAKRLVGALGEHAADALGGGGVDHVVKGSRGAPNPAAGWCEGQDAA